MAERVSAIIFKAFIPLVAIGFMVLLCYPLCNRPEGFDLFLFWILVGFPFGVRRMRMWLIPKNYDIAGSIGILALNCIVGGLIGGVVVFITVIRAVTVILSTAVKKI